MLITGKISAITSGSAAVAAEPEPRHADAVAQIANLLCRRLAVGRRWNDSQAASLRHSRQTVCATFALSAVAGSLIVPA